MGKLRVLSLLVFFLISSKMAYSQNNQSFDFSGVDSLYNSTVWESYSGDEIWKMTVKTHDLQKEFKKSNEKVLKDVVLKGLKDESASDFNSWQNRASFYGYINLGTSSELQDLNSLIRMYIDDDNVTISSFKTNFDKLINIEVPSLNALKVFPFLTKVVYENNFYEPDKKLSELVFSYYEKLKEINPEAAELSEYVSLIFRFSSKLTLTDEFVITEYQKSPSNPFGIYSYLQVIQKQKEWDRLKLIADTIFTKDKLSIETNKTFLANAFSFYTSLLDKVDEFPDKVSVIELLKPMVNWDDSTASKINLNNVSYSLHPVVVAARESGTPLRDYSSAFVKVELINILNETTEPDKALKNALDYLDLQIKGYYLNMNMYFVNQIAEYLISNLDKIKNNKKVYAQVQDFLLQYCSTSEFYNSSVGKWFKADSKNPDVLLKVGLYFAKANKYDDANRIYIDLQQIHKKTAKKLNSEIESYFSYYIPISFVQEALKVKIKSISINGERVKFKKKQDQVQIRLIDSIEKYEAVLLTEEFKDPIIVSFSIDSLVNISSSINWSVPDEMIRKLIPENYEFVWQSDISGDKQNAIAKTMAKASVQLLSKIRPESVIEKENGNGARKTEVKGRLNNMDRVSSYIHFVNPLQEFEFISIISAPKNQ